MAASASESDIAAIHTSVNDIVPAALP